MSDSDYHSPPIFKHISSVVGTLLTIWLSGWVLYQNHRGEEKVYDQGCRGFVTFRFSSLNPCPSWPHIAAPHLNLIRGWLNLQLCLHEITTFSLVPSGDASLAEAEHLSIKACLLLATPCLDQPIILLGDIFASKVHLGTRFRI